MGILKGKTVFFQYFLAPQAKIFGAIYGDFLTKIKPRRKKLADFENNKTPERKIPENPGIFSLRGGFKVNCSVVFGFASETF